MKVIFANVYTQAILNELFFHLFFFGENLIIYRVAPTDFPHNLIRDRDTRPLPSVLLCLGEIAEKAYSSLRVSCNVFQSEIY